MGFQYRDATAFNAIDRQRDDNNVDLTALARRGIALVRELSDRTRARVMANGELMATEIGSRFLRAQGVDGWLIFNFQGTNAVGLANGIAVSGNYIFTANGGTDDVSVVDLGRALAGDPTAEHDKPSGDRHDTAGTGHRHRLHPRHRLRSLAMNQRITIPIHPARPSVAGLLIEDEAKGDYRVHRSAFTPPPRTWLISSWYFRIAPNVSSTAPTVSTFGRLSPAGKLRTKNRIPVGSADEVMVTTGGIHGLYIICQALLEPGDEIIVPDPEWPPCIGNIIAAQGVPVPCPLHEHLGWRFDLDELGTLSMRLTQTDSTGLPTVLLLEQLPEQWRIIEVDYPTVTGAPNAPVGGAIATW